MKVLLRLIGPVLFLLILLFLIDLDQLRSILQDINMTYFSVAFLLSLLLVFIRSLRWRRILHANNIPYAIFKSFRIYCVEMLAVIIASTVGAFIKVAYLKKDGFGTRESVLSVIADKYYDYTLPFILGATSAGLIVLRQDANTAIITLSIVAVVSFIPLTNLIPFIKSTLKRITPSKATAFLAEKQWGLGSSMSEIKGSLTGTTYLLTLTAYTIYYFSVFLLCSGLSIGLTFPQVVMIETFATLVSIIPVGFMGVGTRDAALMAGFHIFGYTFEEAIALSLALLLLRVFLLLFGSIFWLMDPPDIKQSKA